MICTHPAHDNKVIIRWRKQVLLYHLSVDEARAVFPSCVTVNVDLHLLLRLHITVDSQVLTQRKRLSAFASHFYRDFGYSR